MAQKAAFDTLSDDEQLAFLAKVSAAKDEVDEFKAAYQGVFSKTPSLQKVQGFLKSGQQFYRIDVGGSLIYRAQGTPKGARFGTQVDELNALRDAGINAQSA